MNILKAEKEDLEKILELQKLAYLSEAKILNNYEIPPLKQTLEELLEELNKGIILKAVDSANSIIGSVRGFGDGSTLFIGKLMVHPDFQNKGIGKSLLLEIEKYFKEKRCELFTSSKSDKNLHLYTKNGYKEFKRFSGNSIELVYLEKIKD